MQRSMTAPAPLATMSVTLSYTVAPRAMALHCTLMQPPPIRLDFSEQLAAEARLAFARNVARGEAGINLAEAALQVAAEDDAIGGGRPCLLPYRQNGRIGYAQQGSLTHCIPWVPFIRADAAPLMGRAFMCLGTI